MKKQKICNQKCFGGGKYKRNLKLNKIALSCDDFDKSENALVLCQDLVQVKMRNFSPF